MVTALQGRMRSSRIVSSLGYTGSKPITTSFMTAELRKARWCSTIKDSPKEIDSEAPTSPFSSLPNTVLLRSLIINSISSKPWLLTPSLAFMSFISQPGRGLLLNPDRNVILHSILKNTFYKQFCTGETGAETRAKMDELKEMGFRGTILTYAKETTFDHHTNKEQGLGVTTEEAETIERCGHIDAWYKGTLETVDLLKDGDQLAVKLTGAGPVVTAALAADTLPPQQMMDALYDVSARCKERGGRILVDAESQRFQWGIMKVAVNLMQRYNRDGYAVIYNTYQAYLKSTADTLDKDLALASEEGFTLGLKLVRGAYLSSDQRSLIHDTKQDTDDSYDSIAQGALKQQIGGFGVDKPFPSVNLILCGHNKKSMLTAYKLHRQRVENSLPTVPVAFAQLQGMCDEVSFSLLQMRQGRPSAPDVYKCSTWGGLGECLAYLLRRALENRDAASRTVDEYNLLKAEAWRRMKSVFSSSRTPVSS